jgi:SGNH domain (fused to AT3 domains)
VTGRRRIRLGPAPRIALGALAAVLLAPTCPSAGAARSAGARGAEALPEQPQPQETAVHLQPSPAAAPRDRPGVVSTGCMVGIDGTSSGRCLFGDPEGSRAMILFGDSHAMQYFPPLEALAKANHWRLYVLNKRECPPSAVPIRGFFGGPYRACELWRRHEMRRIERFGPRTGVIMSGDTAYTAYSSGRELRGLANGRAQEAGYVATLERIRAAGPRPVVIRDTPVAPRDMPLCVANHPRHLGDCAFRRARLGAREFDVRAARAVPGTALIDPVPEVCPRGLCRAVIGDAIVYRDRQHLTATFARTLGPFIGAALRAARIGQPPAEPAPAPPSGPSYG